MTTESDANLARQQNAQYLRNLGAHAIAVDEVGREGHKDFAVIAFFEKKPPKVPGALRVRRGTKKLEVPLVTMVQEKFKPE